MNIGLTLLLSFIAMFCWGVLYVFTTKLTRTIGPFLTLIAFQSVSILMHLPLIPIINQPIGPSGILSFATLGLWSGLMWILFLYATQIGNVAVVIPVSNLSIPLIAFLGVIFLQESFSLYKAISILLVLIGVILLALDFKAIKELKKHVVFTGVVPAVLAGLGISIYVFINTFFVRWYGWFNSSLFIRVGIIITACIVMYVKKQHISLNKIPWKWVIVAAFVDTVGFLVYNLALTGSELSYVSVITNSSSVVTVLLSFVFLKEKLNKIQLLGFVCTIGGILLLQLH